MPHTSHKHHYFWLVASLALIFTACQSHSTAPPAFPTTTAFPIVRPFTTATPSPTPAPAIRLTSIPEPPAPSATPFTHSVVKDETMLGIALKYGIKLEDLLAANPTVNPRILSIGTVLIVPLPVEDAEPTPTLTPLPLDVAVPVCYLSYSKDLICLVKVKNPLGQAVENLSVRFGLIDSNRVLTSQVSVPPLNILYAGESILVQANFPGPLPANTQSQVELLTAYLTAEDDPRYLPVEVENVAVNISSDRLSAQVLGRVSWLPEQPPPGTLWVVANAYDALGRPVGVRKLETRPACRDDVTQGTCLYSDFELLVYSLGPGIEQIELLVEARP